MSEQEKKKIFNEGVQAAVDAIIDSGMYYKEGISAAESAKK